MTIQFLTKSWNNFACLIMRWGLPVPYVMPRAMASSFRSSFSLYRMSQLQQSWPVGGRRNCQKTVLWRIWYSTMPLLMSARNYRLSTFLDSRILNTPKCIEKRIWRHVWIPLGVLYESQIRLCFVWMMDTAKVTKSFYFVLLPLLTVIYHILEVTAAYYNIKC